MSASFYTTELEATTALVLDRSAFLDSVTDAVTSEHADKDAQKMVAILGGGSFLTLLTVLLSDKDTGIRTKAYLALGNLVASDNRTVAKQAFAAVSRYTGTIGAAFEVAETAKGAAYLVANLAQRIVAWKDEFNAQKPAVAGLIVKGLASNPSSSSLNDLLFAAKFLGASQLVPTDLLFSVLKDGNKCRGIALHHLAEQISNEFAAEFHERCYGILRNLVLNNNQKLSAKSTINLQWALSNLVTEPDMPAAFLTDCDLMDQVCALTANVSFDAAREAVWTLINVITLGDISETPAGVLDKINVTLKTAAYSFAYSLNTAIKETTLKIDAEVLRRFTAANLNYAEDAVSADMEIDDAATLPVEEEETEYYESWRDYIGYEIPSPIEPPFAAGAGSCFPPTAVDLLMGNKYYDGTSRVVYDLIHSVESSGNQFVPVPENVTLSIADLRALEVRGFVIMRGYVGINPLLSSICC